MTQSNLAANSRLSHQIDAALTRAVLWACIAGSIALLAALL